MLQPSILTSPTKETMRCHHDPKEQLSKDMYNSKEEPIPMQMPSTLTHLADIYLNNQHNVLQSPNNNSSAKAL